MEETSDEAAIAVYVVESLQMSGYTIDVQIELSDEEMEKLIIHYGPWNDVPDGPKIYVVKQKIRDLLTGEWRQWKKTNL